MRNGVSESTTQDFTLAYSPSIKPVCRRGMSRGRDTSSKWPRRGMNALVHRSSPVAPRRM